MSLQKTAYSCYLDMGGHATVSQFPVIQPGLSLSHSMLTSGQYFL